MSSHHLSRRDAERIVDAPAESDLPVGHALQALRAPGRPAELLREDAAVAAFHSARLAPAPRAAGAVAPTRSRTAALRAVAATGLVVAVTSGGFALAATGHLPALPDRATEAVTQHPATRDASPGDTATEATSAATSASETAPAPAAASGTSASSGTASEDASGRTEDATAAPTARLEGLCRAFQASDKSAHGAALDSAAFAALAAAARGRGAIASYCVALVGEPKATGTPPPRPTPAATGKPTSKPTPSGAPTAKPTGKPTDKPSAKPSAKAPTGSAPTAPGQASTPAPPADQGKPTDTGKPETTGKP